ncbi:hypothetical protein [uncultured Capnocytophaga sp.]|uniref:hypothetical protein n=1 Tax=uncultured Capnocytophaga sp. TaxID=159273 RepID=UPI00261DB8D3|nr:hypothetical protein [uncultured Capnocytophaga sp.]
MNEAKVQELREQLSFVKDNRIKVDTMIFEDYSDLMYHVKSLITLCAEVCFTIENKQAIQSSNVDIYNVLRVTEKLIPTSDMDILDQFAGIDFQTKRELNLI